jgi:hypothetical protein
MTDLSISSTVAARAVELLAETAELEAAVVRRVQGRMMVAEDDAALHDLGRTLQRATRSLRQSLALQTKIARDQEAHRVHHSPLRPERPAPPPRQFDAEAADRRIVEVTEAVARVAWTECEPAEVERLDFEVCDAFTDLMNDDPQFVLLPIDAQVAAICELLDLPADRARRWRTLPPAGVPADASPPPPDVQSSA